MRPSKGRMVCMIEFISLRRLFTFGEGLNVLLGVTALFAPVAPFGWCSYSSQCGSHVGVLGLV
jgi:hypothetical protein